MQGQQRPDLEHLQARVRPEDVVDDEHAVRLRNAHAHRLADARREQLRPRERTRAELVQIEVAVAELEQLRPELVLVGVEVLLDEPVILKRPQESVHRGLRETHPVGQVAQAEPARMLAERLEDAHRAVYRLNRLLGHCRIPFDIVEWPP